MPESQYAADFGLSEELVAKLLVRVAARTERGEARPEIRLPLSKSDFPKLLCLDFNKWIDLARAHHKLPLGESFVAALDAVRRGIASGRLVVGLTGANVDEVMKPDSLEQRRVMANFMVDLSANHSLVHHREVVLVELRRTVQQLYLARPVSVDVRSRILQRGVHAALVGHPPPTVRGLPVAIAKLLADVGSEPEMSVSLLTAEGGHNIVREGRAENRAVAAALGAVRKNDAHRSLDERFQMEIPNLLEGALGEALVAEVLEPLNIDPPAFFGWLREPRNALAVRAAVPGLEVMGTLMFTRDRNADNPAHENDGDDFALLQVAIPYANIVVTENSWAHIARQARLDRRFGSVILARLHDLPLALAQAGCS